MDGQGKHRWMWGALLALGYGALWYALLRVSYEIWFLPAGLRLGALWVVPYRYWPWLALGEWGVLSMAVHFEGGDVTSSRFVALNILPWLLYAGTVWLFRGGRELGEARLPPLLAVLGSGLFCAGVISPLLTFFYSGPSQWASASLAGAFAYLYGDFIGQLVMAPLILLLASRQREQLLQSRLLASLAILSLVMLMIMAMLDTRPDLSGFVISLVYVPLLLLAFREGWAGAALGVAVVGVFIEVMTRMGLLSAESVGLQISFAAIGSAALMLGVAVSELRQSHEELAHRNRDLAQANQELGHAADELSDISRRLVRVEEQGQRALADALDYEMARNLHSLGTQISLGFRQTRDEAALRLLESLREQVRETQDGLRHALRRLRPRELDSLGLKAALTRGLLREALEDAGIGFEAEFIGDVERLSGDASTALYRIWQAVVEDTVASKRAHTMRLRVHVFPSAMDRYTVELDIRLSGEGVERAASLPPVHDRVLALRGDYQVRSEAGTSSVLHRIRFEEARHSQGG